MVALIFQSGVSNREQGLQGLCFRPAHHLCNTWPFPVCILSHPNGFCSWKDKPRSELSAISLVELKKESKGQSEVPRGSWTRSVYRLRSPLLWVLLFYRLHTFLSYLYAAHTYVYSTVGLLGVICDTKFIILCQSLS